MLPRVRAVAPEGIPASQETSTSTQSQEQQLPPERRLKIVESELPQDSGGADSTAIVPQNDKQRRALALAQVRAFGHLVHQLLGQLKAMPVIRWIGVGAYQATMKLSKKTGKIRKGALVDRKAG